ncbi:unnamed protein product [Rotaria sordida]|uniref:Uncharacterized protein n=1 Tax=Rotaria sordida TaxID=392033 RepID=A0A814LES4_9BILA|nr:unnamed protein product [Rotaria sordida]
MSDPICQLMDDIEALCKRCYHLQKSNNEMYDYIKEDNQLQEYINENEKIIEKYHRKINEILQFIKENSNQQDEIHWSPMAIDYKKMEEEEKRLCDEKRKKLIENPMDHQEIISDDKDFYHLYEIFSNLNQHFNKLIQHYTEIYIDFDPIPNGKLLTFCLNLNQFITTSKNYPLSIYSFDKHRSTLILNDNLFKDKFFKLELLTISNIKIKTLSYALFYEKTKSNKTLERLSLLYKINGEYREYDGLETLETGLRST